MTTKQFLFASLTILSIVGCGSGDNGSNSGSMDIAVIPKGSTHEYWKHVHAGASEAEKEFGVHILFQGPEKEDDKQSQISMMDTMISRGVKGIVLAPLDYDALAGSVEQATKAGIPVVIIDSGVKTDQYVSMVSTNNEDGGKKDADEMIRLLNGKGNLIVLRYQSGSASTDAREKGFIEEIGAKAPDMKIVSNNQYAGPTRETATKASESLLAAFKKGDKLSIDGIYTPNESSTYGMMTVLEQNHWAGKVKFVGFDAAPELLDGLKSGAIDALIVQNPEKMGHDGVKILVDYIKGNKNQPKSEDTGATLVTKANMAEPAIAKLLASPSQ